MNANLESKFKPLETPAAKELSAAKVSDPNATVEDENTAKNRTSFRDLLMNSNDDMSRNRAAQKNGDAARTAKTDAEFAQAMVEKANQANQRKPQNELDKDAFLKLFVTQMRNQDPLSPDNSSQMAAQLAQFHGLEQMMNVNKNLEKMQTDNSVGRAVSLINFVGKDLKLESGKLQLESGKIVTDSTARLAEDSAKTMLEVRDSSGAMVASEDLGPVQAGEHKLEWDGKDKDGKQLGDGVYTFSIVAQSVQGTKVDASIHSMVRVTGVDLHDEGGAFYTPLGKVRISEVASVGDAGFGSLVAKNVQKTAQTLADGDSKAVDGVPAVDPSTAGRQVDLTRSDAATAAAAAAAAGTAAGAAAPAVAGANLLGVGAATADGVGATGDAGEAAGARARSSVKLGHGAAAPDGTAPARAGGAKSPGSKPAAPPVLEAPEAPSAATHNLTTPSAIPVPVEHPAD